MEGAGTDGAGLLNKQIAYSIDVQLTTVKAHVSSLLQKLGASRRTQAVILVPNIAARPTRTEYRARSRAGLIGFSSRSPLRSGPRPCGCRLQAAVMMAAECPTHAAPNGRDCIGAQRSRTMVIDQQQFRLRPVGQLRWRLLRRMRRGRCTPGIRLTMPSKTCVSCRPARARRRSSYAAAGARPAAASPSASASGTAPERPSLPHDRTHFPGWSAGG